MPPPVDLRPHLRSEGWLGELDLPNAQEGIKAEHRLLLPVFKEEQILPGRTVNRLCKHTVNRIRVGDARPRFEIAMHDASFLALDAGRSGVLPVPMGQPAGAKARADADIRALIGSKT